MTAPDESLPDDLLDDGCFLSPSCLQCPRPSRCLLDEPEPFAAAVDAGLFSALASGATTPDRTELELGFRSQHTEAQFRKWQTGEARRGPSGWPVDRVVEMVRSGWTRSRIAAALKLSTGTVARILRTARVYKQRGRRVAY